MKGLITLKRVSTPFFLGILQPFKTVGFVLVKVIGVPAYRGIFFVRRFVKGILLPAKHRFFYLLSNRYTIHIFIIILVGIVGITNIQTQNVRAETFGQKSILYSLVSVDDSETVEIVEAGKTVLLPGGASSYFTDTPLDTRTQFHQDEINQTIADEAIAQSSTQTAMLRSTVETYTVKEGDTLGRLSVKFHLSISTILSANKLTLHSTLHLGDTLKILPVDGMMYTVKRGDTLSKIANDFSIRATDVASSNKLAINTSLQVGTELLLPGATQVSAPAPIVRKPVGVKDLFIEVPTSKQTKAGRTESTTPTSSGWVWPSNYHVITQYFSWKHTGVDIDGDYTTFSIAAHDGVVSYTGWRNGYGLTIEVDHGNGLKTRYGHNSKIFVSVGDVVTAGQKLAQTGSTGNSTGTHLHFEVILNGKFQNPLGYIR